MPGLESIARTFQSGSGGGGWYEHHRARKEELEDEERQSKVLELHDERNKIRDKNANLKEGDPEYQKNMQALADIQSQIDQIYHPIHAPGALAKDWDFLTGLITRKGKKKGPVPPAAVPETKSGDVAVDPDKLISGDHPATPAAAMGDLPASSLTGVASDLGSALPAMAAGVKTAALAKPPIQGTPLAEIKKAAAEKEPGGKIALPSAPVTIPGTTQPSVGLAAVPDAQNTMAVPMDKVKGLVAPGNISIWDRPTIQNADGSHSSEYSVSYKDEDPNSPYYGKEVLVPTVVNGKFLTPDGKKPPEGSDAEKKMFAEAWKHYGATHQHLGVFDNSKNADKYAGILHSRDEREKPDAEAYQPKKSSYERKLQAQQDQATKEAEQFMRAGPASPEEEEDVEIRKKVAGLKGTMTALDDLMGPDWDTDEREEVRQSLIHTALSLDNKEKYFSNLQTTVDPATGQIHVYKVPQKPGAQPEEVHFGAGEQFTGKGGGADGTKGSDFYKALVAKYGPHPTPEQWEAEKRLWAVLGAHGTSRVSTTDAAGNTTMTSVPVFTAAPAEGVRTRLGLTSLGIGESYGGGGAAAPMFGGGAGRGAGGGTAAGAATAAGGDAAPAIPAFADADPQVAAAAMAAANRIGMGRDVLAVANYQLPESSVAASRGSQRSRFMDLVLAVNPGYSVGQYDSVQQTRKAFTAGGNDSKALQSLNTAVHHLQTLLDSANKLGNTEFPLANRGKNALMIQTGHSEPTDFMAAGQAVADEVGRVFRSVGLTETETQGWKDRLDYNMSPTQIRGAIKKMIELMAGRMQAEANTYKTTMGSMRGFPTLDPDVENILRGKALHQTGAQTILEINEEAKRLRGGAPVPTAATPPAPAPTKRGAAAQPAAQSGSVYARSPDGQWYEVTKGSPIPAGYTVYAP